MGTVVVSGGTIELSFGHPREGILNVSCDGDGLARLGVIDLINLML